MFQSLALAGRFIFLSPMRFVSAARDHKIVLWDHSIRDDQNAPTIIARSMSMIGCVVIVYSQPAHSFM